MAFRRKTRIERNSIDNAFPERNHWLRSVKHMMYHFIPVVHQMLNKDKMIHHAHHAHHALYGRCSQDRTMNIIHRKDACQGQL